jgi:hypothetical protein
MNILDSIPIHLDGRLFAYKGVRTPLLDQLLLMILAGSMNILDELARESAKSLPLASFCAAACPVQDSGWPLCTLLRILVHTVCIAVIS